MIRSCSKCPRRRFVLPPLINGFDSCGCFVCSTTRSPSARLVSLGSGAVGRLLGAAHLERWRSRCRWTESEPWSTESKSESTPGLAAKNAADAPSQRKLKETKNDQNGKIGHELLNPLRRTALTHMSIPLGVPLVVHRVPSIYNLLDPDNLPFQLLLLLLLEYFYIFATTLLSS